MRDEVVSSEQIPAPHHPRCIPLDRLGDEPAGGKAAGLARLIQLGLPVPPGFAVVGAQPGSLPADLPEVLKRVVGPGPVAVRSSAIGEDSPEASCAGQYVTLLEVEGVEAVRAAVERCVASLTSTRAEIYRRERTPSQGNAMCVVVQRMVPARAAGVVFTADPISGRRDRLVVDAVRGPGEALVSGQVTPDHYVLSGEGSTLVRELAGESAVLDNAELSRIAGGALRASRAFASPLDLEWAITAEGELFWLQARSITALPADPRELDTPSRPTDVCTSGNIGECMVGAVTPLTFSTVWWANEVAQQLMQQEAGLPRAPGGYQITRYYYGHMFFNLTEMALTSSHVLGCTDESLGLAIVGRVVPELRTEERAPLPVRLWNALRFARYVLAGKRRHRRLEELVSELRFPELATAAAQLAAIEERLPWIVEAFDLHNGSSAASGALQPMLMQVLARGKAPAVEHAALLVELLARCSRHDVESAMLLGEVDRLLDALQELPEAGRAVAEAGVEDALAWIRSEAAGRAASLFEELLSRHGHRCLRELELREKGWAVDPTPLVESLQVGLRARLGGAIGRSVPAAGAAREMRGLGWLVRATQASVSRRERTKSLLVHVVTAFKHAYRRLGDLLAAEGLLLDADSVFFLTRWELRVLVDGGAAAARLRERAVARRRTHRYLADLAFPDVFTGSPEPAVPGGEPVAGPRVLHGKPVSRGRVSGVARVARSLREALALQPGEILISPVTDIGWSPYFSIIKGLATDVGSSVSHGAVVAREYGLPAVVDLRQATALFRTGDHVVLDGDRGILSLEEPAERPKGESTC